MSADTVSIVANGKPQSVRMSCSVAEFLSSCGWRPTQVVVELNGQVLARPDLTTTILSNEDRLEIIVPVAGG